MKKIIAACVALCSTIACAQNKGTATRPDTKITTAVLQDKIKGGWAGQTIGVTYGGPFEFKFNGTMVQDYIPVKPWDSTTIEWWYDHGAGLYDDVYMDLTFVKVFDKYGLNAPLDSFANAFAYASYPLWHANQAARYNLLNGVKAPQSGHWRNNPHADDIDFQIEADFAGLMAPGMVNTATTICDSIGHIMNYGEGWYGGVYVAAMYSLAFVSDDINWIVTEALQAIPKESRYRQCMEAVIAGHKKYPDDWKRTWFEVERNFSEDLHCPDGVFAPFNIDATTNSAYILIGLLYGGGDFTKTMDISMRCGQDADCNPASAAGILGTMIGYSRIPEKYLAAIRPVEARNFVYTDASLNDLYRMSYNHALQLVRKHNGTVNGADVTIPYQAVKPVRLEEGFEGHYPVKKTAVNKPVAEVGEVQFNGNGIIFKGYVQGPGNYVAQVDLLVDGKPLRTSGLPANHTTRRDEVGYAYELPAGSHVASLQWKNPNDSAKVQVLEVIVFDHPPVKK